MLSHYCLGRLVSRQYPDWTEEDYRRELDKWPAEKQRAVGEGTPGRTLGTGVRPQLLRILRLANPATTSTKGSFTARRPAHDFRPCAEPTGWRVPTICSTTKIHRTGETYAIPNGGSRGAVLRGDGGRRGLRVLRCAARAGCSRTSGWLLAYRSRLPGQRLPLAEHGTEPQHPADKVDPARTSARPMSKPRVGR